MGLKTIDFYSTNQQKKIETKNTNQQKINPKVSFSFHT